MSILDINSILSTIPSYPVNPKSGFTGPAVSSPSPRPEPSDRYTQGEYWQNRAVSQGADKAQESSGVYSRSDIVSRVRPPHDSDDAIAPQSGQSGEVEGDSEEAAEGLRSPGTTASTDGSTKPTGEPLSQSELAMVESLKKADQAVRAHEMAHLAAAGGLAKGGASFKLQKGPDGKSYAVGGEVQIDVSKGATPEMTAQKMRSVRRAALAPVDPSPQDQKVAAQATLQIAEAVQELSRIRTQDPGDSNAEQPQEEGGSQGASTGDIYQDYGRTLINEPEGNRPSSPFSRSAADYGLSSAFSPNTSSQSSLDIIA